MNDGWEVRPLGEVLSLNYGKPLSPADRSPQGEFPAYGANGVKARTDKHLVDQVSIIVGRKGSAGEVLLSEERFWPLDVTYYADFDRSRHNVVFLFYLLSSLNLPALAKGVKPGLNRNDVYAIEIPVPPLAEQERIVRILDETLGLLKAVEVRLEETRIACMGVAPALWDEQMFRGEGYAKAKLADVTQIKSGFTLPKSLEKPSGEIPYVKVADMNLTANREGIITSSRFVNMSEVNPAGLVPSGATVFPKRGGAILTNKKRIVRTPIWLDLNMMALIPGPRLQPNYLFLFMLNLDLRKINNGSSIPQINNYSIGPQPIEFPTDMNTQHALTERIMNVRAECAALDTGLVRKLSAVTELRASVLHQAFAGEL